MSMIEWAENEVRIACERENPNRKEGEFDYGCACYDINHPTVCHHSGLVDSIINGIWPITMPYCPDGTIKVYCEDFLTNKKNGDFDTVGIFYAIKSDGTKVDISRFFKKDEPFDTDWVELSREQYDNRKAVKK